MAKHAVLGAMAIQLIMASCERTPQRTWHYDCDAGVEREIFLSCLERLPRGPERLAAAGNDWDEVVVECRNTARQIGCKVVWEVLP